jgi:two-component system, cell cycle sensor histidine kinase and response regulator CckA
MAERDGRLLFANAAFMRAADREDDKPPTYPTDLVVQEDKRALSEAIRRFAQGAATSGDIAVRLASQPDEPVSLSLAGVRGLGEAAVLLGLTDSTEESRLKRQVAQATKMQAVGQLAGGVAHDFNNVLTAILGTCDLMLMRHSPGDSDYDDIQQIRANSNRAASLTRQLLAFSRQQTLRPEVLQLPDVVSDVSQMLKRLIGEKIQLVVSHDRDLGPVRADPSQLEQVIVNLVVNARDAMQARADKPGSDTSGKLTLATRRITAADLRAMDSEIIPAGDYTALIVEDTGGGIPPENLGKIFEPFFTTKDQGKGTGLGLSTVYGIVKQSGGFIFADSEPGKGAKFTAYLPVHFSAPGTAQPAGKVAAPEKPSEWAGGGRILLVEDEDPVRMVAERALTRQGYEVTMASDGEEGLEYVQLGRRYDLVVSDVVMPSMDGPAMAREIRKLAPDLPVLLMSGYAEEQLRNEIDIEMMHFLPKPFSIQQLSEKVGEVLAGQA